MSLTTLLNIKYSIVSGSVIGKNAMYKATNIILVNNSMI